MAKEKIIKKKITKNKVDKYYGNNDAEALKNVILNKSDMGFNNNKFYIAQLIKDKNSFIVYSRYGRVGKEGVVAKKTFPSLDIGNKEFQKLIKSKIAKKYIEIKLETEEKVEIKKNKEVAFKKEQEIKDMIELIFNKTLLKKNLTKLGYNEEKLPLGKLSEETISKGFETLEKLEKAIKLKNNTQINELNNLFFSLIPHNIGLQQLSDFIINNLEKVKDENLKLVVIKNMKNSNELMSKGEILNLKEKYEMLNCDIQMASKKEYKLIENALNTTNRNYNLDITSIFKLKRKNEIFKENIGNKHLLWHGSTIPNFVGIISQGLRIAPKEAPHNGYAYGKGIYMADCSNLSLGYSRSYSKEEDGLILLVETVLGKQHNNRNGKYDKSKSDSLFVGTKLNCKQDIIDGAILNHSPENINYNMYISYDPHQVRIKYLIRYKIK